MATVSKIAFVSTMLGTPWGGSEELWSQTALRLLASGHRVDVSVPGWPARPKPVEEIVRNGGRVAFRTRKPALVPRMIAKLRARLAPEPLDHESMEWLRAVKPDLLVISQGGPWDSVPWLRACRKIGIPYCPIVHAHNEHWWPEDDQLGAGLPALLGASRLFFVSKSNRNLMELQCGTRFKHAEVVVNPWKVDATEPVAWPEETGTVELACVGRIDPRSKGQDLLMQVMALPKWRERPVRVNLYGDGPCEESVKSLAEMFGLTNVVFRGQVSDVRSIWAANHALLLPSRYEGLPLVIVEALFCGRVVITTDVAGNAEYLTDGETGFVAAAPTVSLLDEAMERAWERRAEWKRLGETARAHALAAIPADPIGLFAENLLKLAAQPT
jgi:glycosyltransferase involved in cell wall biosynthesis